MKRTLALLLLASAIVLALAAPPGARSATFVVTSQAEADVAGTLRHAIEQAELTTAPDTITFSIGSGAQTITLGSDLPAITNPLTIDGTSQPGYAGTPLITLDGQGGVVANC